MSETKIAEFKDERRRCDRMLTRISQPEADEAGWVALLCIAGAVATLFLGYVLTY